MAIVISVYNQKGGVAKTTTAVNLAAALATKDLKILLVDTDSQGNATSGVGITGDDLPHSIYDCLLNIKMTAEEIQSIIQKTEFGLDIFPANILLSNAEQVLTMVRKREELLDKILSKIKHLYDYIIIDSPPSLGILSLNNLVASDYIIIPIAPGYFSSLGIKSLLENYHAIKEDTKPSLEILGVLLTRYDGRKNIDKETLTQLNRVFEDKVFKTLIRTNTQIEYAQANRSPIIAYDKSSNGYTDYMNLMEEVIKLCQKEI